MRSQNINYDYFLKFQEVFKLCFLLFAIFGGLFIFLNSASAATYVSGTISTDTTWTVANSPYVVQDYVEISQDVTLTIEPSVIVKFESSYIDVYGKIIAQGTAQDKIYFTSFWDDAIGGDTNNDSDLTTPWPGDWYGINFYYPSVGSYFNFSEFRYSAATLYVDSSDIILANSLISFSNDYGVYTIQGNLDIQNNAFTDNYIPLYIDYQTNLTNSENSASNNSYNGIVLYGDSYYFDFNKILNKDLPYILFDGFYINENSQLTIEPGVIIKIAGWINIDIEGTLNAVGSDDDKIIITSLYDDSIGGDTNGDGDNTTPAIEDWNDFYFYPSSSNSRLENVVIKYGDDTYLDSVNLNFNKIFLERNDSGIFVWQGSLVLNNSEIKDGYDGVVVLDGSAVISKTNIHNNFGDGLVLLSGSANVVQSSIYDNAGDGILVLDGSTVISQSRIYDNFDYGLNNLTSNLINAENNWWGDASGPYHLIQNPSGTGNAVSDDVDFIPWLTSDPLTANNVPTLSNLGQYKSDGIIQIQENGITQESTVVFKAILNDSDNDQVKLQIELKEFNQPFDEQNLLESGFVASGSEAVIARYGLVFQSYHWRGRVVDSRGGTSDWQEFGTQGNIDFTIGRIIKVAVILAEPSDKSFDPAHNKSYFETQIIPDVKDYYCEVSFGTRGQDGVCRDGLVNLEFDVFDDNGTPYKLSQTQQYYGENFIEPIQIFLGRDGNNQSIIVTDTDNTEQFVWDAINEADNNVNYNDYEGTLIIYYGDSEQSISLQNYRLSTQEISFSFAPLNTPNEIAKNWISIAENDESYEWIHEFGHALGSVITEKTLFDLYKSALPCNCDYGGDLNDYDVMAGRGIVAELYNYVVHFSSFTKLKLDWLEEDIVGYGPYNIESLETMKFGDKVKRFNTSSNSYYLLEARTNNPQYSKWDMGFFENALIIYKVKPRQMIVKNQSKIIPFVNVSKIIYLPPADFPYRDPVENIKIELTSWSANSFSFKIDTIISELNLIDYTGAILKPEIRLLEEISWYITDPLRRIAGGGDAGYSFWDYVLYDVKDGLGQSFIISLIVILIILVISKLAVRKKIKRSWLKNILTIIIIVVSLLLILRILSNIGFYAVGGKSNFASANLLQISSDVSSPLDLDLHAITPDGKHTGMNYQTGEYENQIPNAIASGDLVYDDEWIFVPEETQVKYYTSSYDIQQFLEQNPDIAQQLPSTQETYALSAIYYDANSQKYESAPLENQLINPGENIIYETTGTTDIAVTSGIVDSQPPATSIFLSGVLGNNNWFISDVQVTLSASDDAGVLKTEYSLDNSQTWVTYAAPFIVAQEGINNLLYRSQDLVGNIEAVKSQEIKIDKTSPEAKIYFNSDTKTLKVEGVDDLAGVMVE